MNDSKISVRYSKALFTTAKEKQLLPVVNQDIESIKTIIDENVKFVEFIENPTLKYSVKIDTIKKIFFGKINRITYDFLILILKNKREKFLKIICLNFQKLYNNYNNIKIVQFYSSYEVNSDFEKKIKELIEKKYNCKAKFIKHIDKTLIGGYLLKVDNNILDMSVKGRLSIIKQNIGKI